MEQNQIGRKEQKTAFTLAEVLITLGVIGVVAAVTMPILITKYQKHQTVVRLKKAYSELQQAVKLSEVENGNVAEWDFELTGSEFFEQYLKPYLNVIAEQESSIFRYKYKQISGDYENGLQIVQKPVKSYILANGTKLTFSSSETGKSMILDINGDKGPNMFGKDAFLTSISPEHGLLLPGRYSTPEVQFEKEPNDDREILKQGDSVYKYGCNKQNGRGMWCGALIMVDGWEIRDDYPW